MERPSVLDPAYPYIPQPGEKVRFTRAPLASNQNRTYKIHSVSGGLIMFVLHDSDCDYWYTKTLAELTAIGMTPATPYQQEDSRR